MIASTNLAVEQAGCDNVHEVGVLEPQPEDPRTKAKYNIFSRLLLMWVDPLFRVGWHRSLEQSDIYAHPREADSEKLLQRFNSHWRNELDRRKHGRKPRLLVAILNCFRLKLLIQGLLFFIETPLLVAQSVLLGNLVNTFLEVGEEVARDNSSDVDVEKTISTDAYYYSAEGLSEAAGDSSWWWSFMTVVVIIRLSFRCQIEATNGVYWAYGYFQSLQIYLLVAVNQQAVALLSVSMELIDGISLITLITVLLHGHLFLMAYKNGMISRIAMTGAIYQKVLSLSQATVGQLSIGHIINLATNDVQRLDQAFIYIHALWMAPLHLGVVTYLLYLEVGWVTFVLTGVVLVQVPLQIFLARMFSHLRLKSARLTDVRIRVMNEVITGIKVIKMYAWEYAFKRVITNLRRKESYIILQAGLVNATSLGVITIYTNVLMCIMFTLYTATGEELTPKKVIITLSLLFPLRLTTVTYFTRGILGLVEARVATMRLQGLLGMDECAYHKQSECLSEQAEVIARNISASWMSDKFKMVLSDINFSVNQDHHLLAVVGPVGSGKSTLLYCLLNELEPTEGTVDVMGTISYASQDPWVFSATLRDNILFGKQYDSDRYDRVIKACALDKDIKMLINGDLTFVGERGMTLSGGQKARVNLARAVYRDANIYLLDDPFSAVDTGVGKHIFEKCLQGLLKDRLVILVTHQVHFAQLASKILVLKEGHVEAYGNHSELLSSGFDPQHLLGLVSGKDVEESVQDVFLCNDENDRGLSLSPSAVRQRSFSFRSQISMRNMNELDIDLVDEDSPFDTTSVHSKSYSHANFTIDEDDIFQPLEEINHGSLSTKIYFQFFRAGGTLAVIIFLLAMIIGECGIVASDWWLSNWSKCGPSYMNSSICFLSTKDKIYIYSGITVFAVVMSFVRALGFYYVCVNASRVLHNRMFQAVLRAPMLFFDTNPIGRILNRFSKDVGFLDDLLPFVFCEFLLLSFRCLAIIITASVANYWVLLPAAMLLVGLLCIRWYYLKTSRDLKRLEAIARSPLYSHFSTTLQGLPVIRSFKKQGVALKHFHDFQNQHTQAWYLYVIIGRWLSMRVDILSTLFITSVCFLSVGLSSYINDVSLLGLGLAYTISLSGLFQYVIRQSTEVENLMTSGERVIAYSNLEPEASLETLPTHDKSTDTWPDKGELHLDNVVFRYAANLPLVLNNLSFSIRSSEKVGIVGRTGAGKSSLISVLYRLAEPGGHINIDGVDTKSIGLHDLRKSMSIIPQDPVLFSGSLRYNLDPFEQYPDLELWKVLEQVQLKGDVEQMEGQLSGNVFEGGANFSMGQRQLLCLARALLRKKKILILDEATANVDLNTDRIIQGTIRDLFSECTILTIAHRLNTIMDSDRIMVMKDGQVVEFDSPLVLLHNSESHFTKIVEKTGLKSSLRLRQMAKDAARA